MLKKSICFKCHMEYYGVDGNTDSGVRCYPPPDENDRKQCEILFEKEWEDNKVWCFGLNNNASNEELEEILGKENWNRPYLNHLTATASKFCDYESEQEE